MNSIEFDMYLLSCFSKTFQDVIFSYIPQFKFLKDKDKGVIIQDIPTDFIQVPTRVINKKFNGFEMIHNKVDTYGLISVLSDDMMQEIYDIILSGDIQTGDQAIELMAFGLIGKGEVYLRELKKKSYNKLVHVLKTIIKTQYCLYMSEWVNNQGFSYDKDQVLYVDSKMCFKVIREISRNNNREFKVYFKSALVNK
jgi:hypothetical protein